MWFGLGLVTFIVALMTALRDEFRAGWRGKVVRTSAGPCEVQTSCHRRVCETRIGVALPDDFRFVLREETRLDRWFKRRGFNDEVQSGDLRFDYRIYVESDDPLLSQLLQDDEGLRAALLQALAALGNRNAGAVCVIARGGRVWFQFQHHEKLDPGRVLRFVLPFLQPLARALASRSLRPPLAQRDPYARRASVLVVASTVMFSVGAVGWGFWGASPDPMLRQAWFLLATVCIALPLGAGLIWLALRWMGPSARAHGVLLELLMTGLPGLVSSAWWLAREANMTLDPSLPRVVQLEGARLERVPTKRGVKYYLLTPDAPVPELAYRRIHIGRGAAGPLGAGERRNSSRIQARITLRSGLFGSPWVERVEFVPRADASGPGR